MKKTNNGTFTLTACILALAAMLATGASAQTGNGKWTAGAASATAAKAGTADAGPRRPDDMRLWTFGDCDRSFPYVDSDEHKQCVRVVGSEEARDARAFRVCETSHEGDSQEAARCKAAYRANRAQAAQDGLIANAAAQSAAPTPPDVMQKVKVITEVAVEHDREEATEAGDAAPPAPVPPAVEEPAVFWTPTTVVGVLCAIMLMVAMAAKLGRRKPMGALASR
jgi:hypothetical protein